MIPIITTNPFPFGGASSNRAIQLSKILQAAGFLPLVYITRGTERRGKITNINHKGFYQNCQFEYSHKSTYWPGNKIARIYNYCTGIIKTAKKILALSPEIIIIYGIESSIDQLVFLLTSKIIRAKCIYLVDEYPYYEIIKNKMSWLPRILFSCMFFKYYDGMMFITRNLKDYYSKFAAKSCSFLILPMTVEKERFEAVSLKNYLKNNDIYYSGFAYQNFNGKISFKDDLFTLFQSFKMLVAKYPTVKLIVVGENHKIFNEFSEKLGLGTQIIFKGSMTREELPQELKKAAAFVLPRSKNLQAQGGFPTKLGEYLMYSIPVVASNVGEINEYLNDNAEIILVEPDDASLLAEKLIWVLENRNTAYTIGENGRKKALTHFDYSQHVKTLKNYIESFPNK